MIITYFYKILRFIFKSKRLDNYISKKLSTISYSKLEISSTIGCAMMCSYCPQELHKANGKTFEKMLQVETLKKVINNIEKNTVIHWTGYSEALGNKKFPEFSELLKKNGNPQLINTTMHGHSNCVEFLKESNNFFQILLHLPDNKNYMKLKVSEKYLKNLEDVIKFQSKSIKDNLFVLGFGDDLQLEVKELINKLTAEGYLKDKNISISKHLHTRAGDRSAENIGPEFHNNLNKENKNNNSLFYCSIKRLNMGVLIPDGRVSLCSHDYSLKYFKGDLKEKKLSEIYENKEVFENNNDFINGTYKPCVTCEYYINL